MGPRFFTDNDGRLYMYNGSSDRYPTYGIELNRTTIQPIGTRTPMYLPEDWRYGWQRYDVPHDYVELENPVQARYIKLENIHIPTGKFAISGFRIFGNGNGKNLVR